jgi:hypothetical protein
MKKPENIRNLRAFVDSEVFKDLADSIVRIIATLEEDGDEEISSLSDNQYSKKSRQLMIQSLGIIKSQLQLSADNGRDVATAITGRYNQLALNREKEIRGESH